MARRSSRGSSRRSSSIGAIVVLVLVAPVLQGCALLFMGRQASEPSVPPAAPSIVPLPVGSPLPSLGPGELPSPSQLVVLTPEEFAAVGIEGAGAPTFDPNGSAGAVYAVYAGRSGSDGGIEVDVFAEGTAEDAAALVGDPGFSALDDATKALMDAERATLDAEQPTNDGTGTYDTLWVQRGRLAAAISVPHTATSRESLIQLATLLLARTAPYQ